MNDRFLRACRREPVDCTPVWMMRQAGRYMAEYRALREKYSMLELCKTPELAVQVTLQPMQHGVDAAILFADILLPLEPMGAPFEFAKGEGPVVHTPIRHAVQVDALRVIEPEQDLDYVLQTVRLLKKELKVPLIGFAGAPFTLASYLVEGGPSKNHVRTKALMHGDPQLWAALCERLAQISAVFLRVQVEAGAAAVQLFDSWAGALSRADYQRHVQPHSAAVLAAVGELGVPRIHFGVGTGELLASMAAAGADVVGVDYRVGIPDALARLGGRYAVQGNLDPALLFAPWEALERETRRILAEGEHAPGHIFNLGHGVLPETDPDVLTRLVDLVHTASARRAQ